MKEKKKQISNHGKTEVLIKIPLSNRSCLICRNAMFHFDCCAFESKTVPIIMVFNIHTIIIVLLFLPFNFA